MMSSHANSLDQIVRITDLFNNEGIENEIIKDLEQIPKDIGNENLNILKDIQDILQNCTILTQKEKLEYCKSQRFFMKLYLKEVNRR
jgi:hypothetical protein